MLEFLANFLQANNIFCIFVLEKAESTEIGAVFNNKMADLPKICCRA